MIERKPEFQQINYGDLGLNNNSSEVSPIVRSVIDCNQSILKDRINDDHWLTVQDVLQDYHSFLEENFSSKRNSLPADIIPEVYFQVDENGDEVDTLELRIRQLSEATEIKYSSLSIMVRGMIKSVIKCFANNCNPYELQSRQKKGRVAIIEGVQRHSRPKTGSYSRDPS